MTIVACWLSVIAYFLGIVTCVVVDRLKSRKLVKEPNVVWNVPEEHIPLVLKEWRRYTDYPKQGTWDLWAAIRKALPDLPKQAELLYTINPNDQTITITNLTVLEPINYAD